MRIFLTMSVLLILSLGFLNCGKNSKNPQETQADETLEMFLPNDWDGKSDYPGSIMKVISL